MLDKLYQMILDSGKGLAGIQTLKVPQEPSHHYYLRGSDGTTQPVEAEAFPRNHEVGSFDSFVDACRMPMYRQQEEKPDYDLVSTPRSVWYSCEGCTVLLDDQTRRDRVTWPLTLSPEILLLKSLSSARQLLSQDDFVRMLRIELAVARRETAVFLESLKKLSFKKEAMTEVGHGTRSIGKKAEAQAYGDVELPEEMSLTVPIFSETLQFMATVECAIEILPEAEKFRLVPYPSSVTRAILKGEFSLGASLESALGLTEDSPNKLNVLLYQGTPH